MGTKGSYTGGGGKPGDAVREGLQEWLDSLPTGGTGTGVTDAAPASDSAPTLPPQRILPAIGLFAPTAGGPSSSRPGRSGRGRTRTSDDSTHSGGAQRSTVRSASTAGRGAAAAYAFGTGNAAALAASSP